MKNVKLKILGSCSKDLMDKYSSAISAYRLEKRVYFPNKSFYGKKLLQQAKDCSVGIALYDVGPKFGTYYADPAKVKTYTQYGLPVIMTNSAQIANYIKKFHAGEIVKESIKSVQDGIKKIKNNLSYYDIGLINFNKHFYYKTYYKQKLKFLET